MHKLIYTVGNMVKIPEENQVSKHIQDNSIIFIGKMSYEPNILAVNYFIKEIYPALREIFPSLKFSIVGSNPGVKIKSLSKKEGIEVTGFVEHIEPYYQKATIVVAPMLTGAGIQNKIIQAMSYGCCVATTKIGAEGLNIKRDEISIFESKEVWIKGLTALLNDRETRMEMGHKARQYVIENFSPEVIEKQFEKFIKHVKLF